MTTPGLTAPHPGDTFELRFSATPRGARLARRLASHRVHGWGHRYGSPPECRLRGASYGMREGSQASGLAMQMLLSYVR
ncbi:hypothetical protein [Streptomyces atroolivaceus]|uniref:hypothetical protein n=1 Tax=Streptomyces atroolivaceus TaxID=66869 RepID=UPI00363980D7